MIILNMLVRKRAKSHGRLRMISTRTHSPRPLTSPATFSGARQAPAVYIQGDARTGMKNRQGRGEGMGRRRPSMPHPERVAGMLSCGCCIFGISQWRRFGFGIANTKLVQAHTPDQSPREPGE